MPLWKLITKHLTKYQMKRYNKYIRFIFFTIAAFLFSSCRMAKGGDFENDSHFLFIPVSANRTHVWLIGYLVTIILLFLFSKLTQSQVGWHEYEIKDNIYDNSGKIIGSIGTGKYYKKYYSQESADKVSNIYSMLQVAATIALVNGIICSWIFAGGSVAFIISFIVLTIVGFIKAISDKNLKERILSHQLWIGILCAILCIIYVIIDEFC